MKKRIKFLFPALLVAAIVTLSGCVRTVDELYRVPRRSEGYQNLQAVMDQQLMELQYSAPSNGENQQAVQTADLDGDDVEEVLLFAKGSDDHPLKVIIFSLSDGEYRVSAKIERPGTSFDQVEYVQMDGRPGLEIVIGTELSDQLLRNVAVYRMENDETEQLMSTNYRKFLSCNLTENGNSDLMVLCSREEEPDHGIVELYSLTEDGIGLRGEARLSQSIDQLKRITIGGLSGGQQAAFVASAVDSETMVTDVFAMVDGTLTNVAQSNESGTSVKTLRNLYVYSEDIDHDGEMEIPSLIPVQMPKTAAPDTGKEHLIRWYSITSRGGEVTKTYTYHNYQQGWYMTLDEEPAERICVVQSQSGCFDFLLWDCSGTELTKLWTVYVLTGDNRSALAAKDNRFILLKTDSTVYAAELAPEAVQIGVTEEDLCNAFHLIQRVWKTGEM